MIRLSSYPDAFAQTRTLQAFLPVECDNPGTIKTCEMSRLRQFPSLYSYSRCKKTSTPNICTGSRLGLSRRISALPTSETPQKLLLRMNSEIRESQNKERHDMHRVAPTQRADTACSAVKQDG
ncbi:hypothetical protein HRR90_004957 [Exophiala dermatitidis]|uniref:Uncharacterized protein n=1 Tax=Exophiala dermatitidis TaxID=5970 RepID=A0AAN6IQS2_EXODE|nr:hypothetical protein HRR86_008911 [Exophiala dermatitidis]KAJ4652275.1 hypothetical protein HRR90_004957 [Exophiala dermatitidis]KAJ8987062.1 hypothetical protein HRR80_008805 [Exophiala dermatitidis]